MKQKLLSILTLLVLCVTGAWAEDPTPGNADSKYLDIANYSTIVSTYSCDAGKSYKYYDSENGVLTILASAVTANGTKQNWVTSNNGGTSSKTWSVSGVTNSDYFKGSTGFKASGNVPAVSIKGSQSTPRNYSFRITNCTEVQALINSSNSNRTVSMEVYPVTGANYNERGELAGSATDNSNAVKVIKVTGLSANIIYEVFITSNSNSESLLYELAFVTPVDTRTNVSLSFPNDTEEATLGESFSAPTLTVSPAAASTAVAYSSSDPSIAEVNSSTGEITLKKGGSTVITAAISGNATYKDASASYTLNVTDPNAPKLNIAPTSVTLSAAANNPTPSAIFMVTGNNLTDGNYTINVPSVAGLSVTPTSVTVADGAVNQEVTVTYAPSVDAAASSDDITLTIDAIDATLTVNYVATLSVYTQETIDAVTTWDFVNDIDHDNSQDVQGTQTTAKLYANTSIKFKSSFPKASLTYTTSDNYYAYRQANKCSQGAVLSFNTSVPGIVTVLFANNGSGSQYVKVNNVTGKIESTDGGSSGATAKEESFPVDAGTVTITGSTPARIRIFRIKFQPTVSATIPESGWGTYCSSNALDFSDENTEVLAYTVSDFNASTLEVTYEKVTGVVPAGTGLLLYAPENGSKAIVTSAEAAVAPTNKLKGFLEATPYNADGDERYLGMSGGSWKVLSDGTIPANKAVLKVTAAEVVAINEALSSGAKFTVIINDGEQSETTGISEELRVKSEESSSAYNLAGQKVGKEYKGIVIVNGKKVIRK